MKPLIRLFTSVRFTAALLALSMVLVFLGTIAQVEHGLYAAQARYFRSFFVFWAPGGGKLQIPVFPGGYLLGLLMVANLISVGAKRLFPVNGRWGLLLVHSGLILLLLGQLLADQLSVESGLRFSVGESRNYSEDFHANELVLMDVTDSKEDKIISLPEERLRLAGDVVVPASPFTLRVRHAWRNADVLQREVPGATASEADQGIGRNVWIVGKPTATAMDERNMPAALIEVRAGGEALGTWLVSTLIEQPQPFSHEGRNWQLALRPKRHYTPFSLTLQEVRHDVYKGTEIPKNFSSRVRLNDPATGEDREVVIWMNNPLRYGGNTYYQYQMAAASSSSTLQVVRNPSRLAPYVSCGLIGVGLVWQFLTHLLGFVKNRRHET